MADRTLDWRGELGRWLKPFLARLGHKDDRDFASRKRQRYQGLAVGGLAERRSILRSDTHRMRTLLGYSCVVNHQHGIAATHELICLNQQFCLQRPSIPDPGSDEVVQLIAGAECKPPRHRLNALAIARTNQTRHVERTHLTREGTRPVPGPFLFAAEATSASYNVKWRRACSGSNSIRPQMSGVAAKPRLPIIAVGREITRLSQKRTPGSLRMPGVGGSCCLNQASGWAACVSGDGGAARSATELVSRALSSENKLHLGACGDLKRHADW